MSIACMVRGHRWEYGSYGRCMNRGCKWNKSEADSETIERAQPYFSDGSKRMPLWFVILLCTAIFLMVIVIASACMQWANETFSPLMKVQHPAAIEDVKLAGAGSDGNVKTWEGSSSKEGK